MNDDDILRESTPRRPRKLRRSTAALVALFSLIAGIGLTLSTPLAANAANIADAFNQGHLTTDGPTSIDFNQPLSLTMTGFGSSFQTPGNTGTYRFEPIITNTAGCTNLSVFHDTVGPITITDSVGTVVATATTQTIGSFLFATFTVVAPAVGNVSAVFDMTFTDPADVAGCTAPTAYMRAYDTSTSNGFGFGSNADTGKIILPTVSAPVITSGNPADGTVGTPFSATVTATGTATITFSVTAGALPDGLSLDPATGVISGTPTTAGTFSYTVTATNDVGTDSADYVQNITASTAPDNGPTDPPASTPSTVVPGTHLPVVAG